MNFNKKLSYILFILIQVCLILKANATIDLKNNENIKLLEVQNKTVEPESSITGVYEIINTTNQEWLIRTGCWREVEVQIIQGGLIVEQQVFSWSDVSKTLICHEISDKRSFLFPINFPQGDIILKIIARKPLEGSYPKNYDISIGTKTYFLTINQNNLFSIMIITIPIVLAFGLFNLILFFFMKDRSYLMYFFVQVSFIGICLATYAYLPFPMEIIFGIIIPVRLLFTACYMLFMILFLNTAQTEPLLHKIFLILIKFTSILFLLSSILLVNMQSTFFKWIETFTIYIFPAITIALMIFLIVKRILKKDKLAYGFGTVMILFCLFALGAYLLQMGILPASKWQYNRISFIMIIESVAFSIVLGYRFRYLKIQLDQSIIDVYSSTYQNELIKSELQNSVHNNFDLNQDWSQVQTKFELLHSDFIKKLKEEHPSLTLTDIKICILLKMNLSPKEIASFLNIQPRSIVQANYRMKKKMKLSSEVVIGDYIRSL